MSVRLQQSLTVCSLTIFTLTLPHAAAFAQVIPKDKQERAAIPKSHDFVKVLKPATITNDTFTNGGGTGLWGTTGNWSAGLPTSSNNVLITGSGGAAAVTQNVVATINNLTVGAGDTWTLSNGESLTLDGSSISNAGKMVMNSTGSGTSIVINSPSLTLTGTLSLSNSADNFIYGEAYTDRLINQGTIQGGGNIGDNQMTLVNSGAINANASAGLTVDANGGASNTGTMEATAGDKMTIANTTVYNTGGTLAASGTGSVLLLSNSNVYGGTVSLTGASTLQLSNSTIQFGDTVNSSSTGTIEAVGFTTNTIGGTISNPSGGILKLDNGAVLNLQSGTYPTLGTVQLNSTGNGTSLIVNGGVTLSGGSVTLSNNANNYIYGGSYTDTLTNAETITGAGHLGDNQMALVNSGTIDANASAGMTLDANGGAANTGTIEAVSGATLDIANTTVANTGGTISANASTLELSNSTVNGGTVTLTGASDLQLSGATVQGGTLTNSSTGTIEAIGFTTNTLGGAINNPSGGILKLDNGSVLNLQSGSYPTLGTVQINSTGNNTELVLNGGVTLSGGSITMSNNAANYIFGGSSTDTLTNQETITGSGQIGSNQMTLINSGTINANGSAGMTIEPNGGTANTGTIEATNGSNLVLSNTTVANAGGAISANASTLKVSNSTVNGGSLTLTGASTLQLNGATVQGGTLTNSSTGTIEALSFTTNTLGGAISNPSGGLLQIQNGAVLNLQAGSYSSLGAVQLNSTGNTTEFVLNGSVTLSGGGVTLSNNAANYIFGSSAVDVLTNQETISGAGVIGDRQMTLINSGTIDATGSAGLTISPNGGTTNAGTIEASAGSPLTIGYTTVNNKGGTISAAATTLEVTSSTINSGAVTLTGASDLQLNGSTIQGGTLTNSSTGTIEALGFTTNTIGGTISNPSGGVLKLDNGAVLHLENGAYPTLGAVQINSTGNATELIVNANATLSAGSVTLSNNPNNYIFGSASGDTLTNQETISGAGTIGDRQMTLINSGTINSNASSGMTISPNGGTTNTGTIEATLGSPLTIGYTTVNNTGGAISANASSLELTSSTVNGGAITLTGASTLQLNGSTIQGGTLTNSSTGNIQVLGFTTNTLGGTVNNPAGGLLNIQNGAVLNLQNGTYPTLGAVQLNSTGNATELVLNGSATLSGGSVTLSNNPNNYIFGNASGDTLTNAETISGAGNIGDGRMTLVNSGTINANQSNPLLVQINGLTNNGTLQVASGSTLHVEGGVFSNFNPITNTLTGGAYNTSGTLEIDNLGSAGGEIVTNAANIVLNGASATFVDSGSKSVLTNLATNTASGGFTLSGGAKFTTAGNFTNSGILTIGTGSTLTLGGAGSYTQTAGTTTDNGTLALSSSGKVTLTGGSLFGQGSVTGALASSATVNPGSSATSTGILTETGAYSQNSTGSLNVLLSGTTAGTSYDQLNPSTASLNGTLNIKLASGYVPAVGNTFKIMNFTSETGSFATVNGLPINSTEHFTITYQTSDVLLTVVSGAASTNPLRPGIRMGPQGSESAVRTPAASLATVSFATPLETPANRRPLLSPRAIPALAFRDSAAAIAMPNFRSAATPPASYATRSSAPMLPRGVEGRRVTPRNLLAYNLNVFSLFTGDRGAAFHEMWKQPGNPAAPSFGALMYTGSH
ncbi:MAG: hypothetical protein JO340_14795 [Acidobacteriaceae bacterium]|nr:hypothetical protein [Acidobacteriaceae bacterium]